jgi:DNA-binding CsgD family transcriptional regulator
VTGVSKRRRPSPDSLESWDEIVGKIYEAALNPESLPDVLLSIAAPMNANAGQFAALSAKTGTVLENFTIGFSEDLTDRDFVEMVERGEHIRANFCSEASELVPIYDYLHSSEEDIRRHPFYQEHAIPGGAAYYAALVLKKDDDLFSAMAICRDHAAGHFRRREIDFLCRIGPHIRRSVELASRLPRQGLFQGLSSLINGFKCGALLIDSRGRVKAMNDDADRIARQGDGISVRGGQLVCSDKKAARALLRELKLAHSADPDRKLSGDGRIRVRRPSENASYKLFVAPIATSYFGLTSSFAVVLIVEPQSDLYGLLKELQADCGLTDAESQVTALLAAGHSPKDIADARGCTIDTVRSHLKTAMHKTGTRRQAELVSWVYRNSY